MNKLIFFTLLVVLFLCCMTQKEKFILSTSKTYGKAPYYDPELEGYYNVFNPFSPFVWNMPTRYAGYPSYLYLTPDFWLY